jgi:large subunit ribosomal protein L19
MKSGDTVRVHVKVREGDKERIQIFEGIVIGQHRGGVRASFHRPQGVVRPGRRAHLPAPLADDRQGGRGAVRSRAPRQAVLPAQLKGKAARMKETRERKNAGG